MPRRTREQQLKHNESRRNLMKKAKKSMFVMEYIKIKHPKAHQEASKLYEFIYALYPSKRDLTKTVEFKKSTENGIVRNMLLEAIDFRRNTNLHPRLEIPLITPPTTTTSTQEKSPQAYETPDEASLIRRNAEKKRATAYQT